MRIVVGGVLVQESMPKVIIPAKEEVVKQVTRFGKTMLPISLGAGILNSTFIAKAEAVVVVGTGLADRLQPLVHLVQDLALPVGICTSIWGIIELMLQNPAGARKIKSSVIGFVFIYVIPTVFYAIRDAFQAGMI